MPALGTYDDGVAFRHRADAIRVAVMKEEGGFGALSSDTGDRRVEDCRCDLEQRRHVPDEPLSTHPRTHVRAHAPARIHA